MSAHSANKQDGLSRSASLLKALGPNAASVWAELDPADAAAITQAMSDLPDHKAGEANAALALLNEASLPGQSGRSVWAELSELKPEALGALLENEHPQVIALTLSRLAPASAGNLLRRFPSLMVTDVLHRMLHMAPAQSGAINAIENNFAARLTANKGAGHARPAETLARIFDAMPGEDGEALLTALHETEPGASARVRALMFTFADLASLTPAGLQTLLSRANRATLTLALKGVDGPVAEAFFSNMTARARDVLTEEIAALGPRPRRDVEMAQTELVTLTRALIDSGDILPNGPDTDEDLIA